MKTTTPPIKFRRCNWLDRKREKELYGIQAKVPSASKWMHCCEGSKPLIYETAEEREAKLKEMRLEQREKGAADE